ncbi:MAG: hypothetical protein AAGE52_23365 [Myxococcota bacterium]
MRLSRPPYLPGSLEIRLDTNSEVTPGFFTTRSIRKLSCRASLALSVGVLEWPLFAREDWAPKTTHYAEALWARIQDAAYFNEVESSRIAERGPGFERALQREMFSVYVACTRDHFRAERVATLIAWVREGLVTPRPFDRWVKATVKRLGRDSPISDDDPAGPQVTRGSLVASRSPAEVQAENEQLLRDLYDPANPFLAVDAIERVIFVGVTPVRPAEVPADATWSEADNTWSCVGFRDGVREGEARHWRRDGSPLAVEVWSDGGRVVRFARTTEHGDVIQQGVAISSDPEAGSVDHGVVEMHKVPNWTREGANIQDEPYHRSVIFLQDGEAVFAQYYDAEGNLVDDGGEELPERPASVPETAGFDGVTWSVIGWDGREPTSIECWDEEGRAVTYEAPDGMSGHVFARVFAL